MVAKILKQLARTGLLLSQRGVNGGYRMARPAHAVTVADVITAIEGPIALTECIEHADGDCARESICQVRGNWQLINRRVLDFLGTITLAEMAGPLAESPTAGVAAPLTRRAAPESISGGALSDDTERTKV
jgi:Rrf2 family protein